MAEYIDKKELLCMINKLFTKNVDGTTANCVYNNALIAVKREIAYCSVFTDVQPVIHSRWIPTGDGTYNAYCENCFGCGARMIKDGDTE